MSTKETQDDSTIVVQLHGDLTRIRLSEILSKFADAGHSVPERIVLDFARAGEIDGSGLVELTVRRTQFMRLGKELLFTNVPAVVRTLFWDCCIEDLKNVVLPVA